MTSLSGHRISIGCSLCCFSSAELVPVQRLQSRLGLGHAYFCLNPRQRGPGRERSGEDPLIQEIVLADLVVGICFIKRLYVTSSRITLSFAVFKAACNLFILVGRSIRPGCRAFIGDAFNADL